MKAIVDLAGKRGLVTGIANDSSIAYGCARAFRAAGAELAVTYLNAKAEPHVRPLAEALGASIIVPCDVREPGQLEAVFDRIVAEWGRLDFLFHSIAFAPRDDLRTSLVNCMAEGFAVAMDVSCHSFIRMARLSLPLMRGGREPADRNLLRSRPCGRELQSHGASESRTGIDGSHSGRRPRSPRHSRPCLVGRPGQDTGRLGHRPLR